MKKDIYQSPQIKILVLSGRKLMDDWVVGGTVVDVQGAKRHLYFDEDEEPDDGSHHNVWDY